MEFVVIWLLCGLVAGIIGSGKGAGCSGFALGVLLGPFGILIAIFMKGDRRACPHCREMVKKDASVCPHCQRELAERVENGPYPSANPLDRIQEEERRKANDEKEARPKELVVLEREARPKSNGTFYGILSVVGVVLLLVIILNLPKGKTRSEPAAAGGTSGKPTSIVPIIHVRNILTVAASDLKGTLRKELDPSASLEFGENSWGGKGWTAKTALATIEVTPWKGKVLEVMVHFNTPIPDRAAALAYLDIQPCTQTPGFSNNMGGATWTYAFSDIYQVIVAPKEIGRSGIGVITVIPSKALNDDFMRQNH